MVPEMVDHKKLAREVRASFQLPQQMKELGMKEADLQGPPAPPCLRWQKFMLPGQSIYAYRDIREIPQGKVVAYVRPSSIGQRRLIHLLEGAMPAS